MEQVYVERSKLTAEVLSQYGEGLSTVTQLENVGAVFGLTIYRLLQQDENRTSAFGDTTGYIGGLSSMDMQKYRDMPDEQRSSFKSILHSKKRITVITSIGEQVGPGVFKLVTEDPSEVQVVKSVDLEGLLVESAQGCTTTGMAGIGYRLFS